MYEAVLCRERQQCLMSDGQVQSGSKCRLKRSKNMLLTLLLPSGMKRTTFRGTWIATWYSWWRYKRFHHSVPLVWTPCRAMQPPGGASWLPFHPKSPHALSLRSLLSLVSLTRHVLQSKIVSYTCVAYYLCCNLFDHLPGGESLLHAPCWNLSVCTSDREFILHAPSWYLPRCSASAESLLHARCWNLSRRTSSADSLLNAPC